MIKGVKRCGMVASKRCEKEEDGRQELCGLDMIPAGIPIQELDLGDCVAKLVNGEAAHRGLNILGQVGA
jgi:hypothetical protein